MNQIAVRFCLWGVIGLGLQGCNLNFSQDPLKDESEAIKQAQLPETVPPPPPPRIAAIRPEELHIDILGSVAEYFSFVEGEEGRREISGRVLTRDASFELSIDNLDDFPGASFDSSKGIFTWTPPFSRTVEEYALTKPLIVRLTASSPQGKTPISTTRDIPVLIYRKERDPVIVEVKNLPPLGFIREGGRHVFEVVVQDPEATGFGGAAPRLAIIPSVSGSADISRHVSVQQGTAQLPNPAQDPSDSTKFVFRVLLDLSNPQGQKARGPDYTASEETFSFGLRAVGRFGNTFQATQSVKVRTDLLKPQSTWTAIDADTLIQFKVGKENIYHFQVFDRRSEGKISAMFETSLAQIDGVASCENRPSSTLGDISCRIVATPPESVIGNLSPCPIPPRNLLLGPKDCLAVTVDLRNQLDFNGDALLERESMTRYIRIVR